MTRLTADEAVHQILNLSSSDSDTGCEDNNLSSSEYDDATLSLSDDLSSDAVLPDLQEDLEPAQFLSKDKLFTYSDTVPQQRGRPTSSNNTPHLNGGTIPQNISARVSTPLSSLKLFITEDMITQILESTNSYLSKKGINFKISCNDIWLWIGANTFLGIMKAKSASLKDMWNDETGIPYLKKCNVYFQSIMFLVMSFYRFSLICRYIRFDVRENRNRLQKDAPISLIWDIFTRNTKRSYVPSAFLTVDEQLCNTRGRVPFKSYIPTKPGKYGIKIWCLCDSTNAYFITGQIYTGKSGSSVEKNQGERVVKELTYGLLDSGRNITCDNFFTTMSLAKYLFVRNTTLVGTVRKTRTFLPPQLCGNSKNVGSEFIFHERNFTICRFTEKPGKSVILLSSQHNDDKILETGKPEIIHFYNSTKAGVDTLDQAVRFYSVKRKTLRWPLTIFYNILDMSEYNSLIIFLKINPEYKATHQQRTRRRYLLDLAKEIASVYGSNQTDNGLDESPPVPKKSFKSTNRCIVCPRTKDVKTPCRCEKCDKSMCKKHMKTVCQSCLKC